MEQNKLRNRSEYIFPGDLGVTVIKVALLNAL
jgi:hypothetical protein